MRRHWLPAFALCACAAAVAVALRGPPRPGPSRETREFQGSYAASVRASGRIHEVRIEAAPTELPLLDGRMLKVWAYNGQVPGPTIRIRLGDTLRATLVNHLPQATTIHWHGVRLPNPMDGVPGITQPPVEPGASFTYEFTPKDAGTFWFHPHLSASEQVERGLYGVLIVEDAAPPPYSRDLVWVLDDWLLGPDGQIAPEFNTRHDLMHDGRWGGVLTVNGKQAGPRGEVLTVHPGERIRLRLLDVANGRIFKPDFSALGARAIAVDGLYAAAPFDPETAPNPTVMPGFEMAPGNRLDLDLTIPVALAGQRVTIHDRYLRDPAPLAEITVAGDPVATPDFPSPARAHVPAWRDTGAIAARAEYRIDSRGGGPFGIQWTLNGEVMDHASHVGHDHAEHHFATLPAGQWSKLRFVNQSYRLHPMHLHGSFFKLLSRNGIPVEERHFRDTVLVHSKETVEVGLVPLDEGRWMMHCHVLEHAESGMMTLVEVR